MRQIHTRREEVLLGAGVGEDCAALKLAEDEIFVISTDPITGTATDIGNLAIHITMNDLASSGAEPVGVMLTILLPEGSEESELKEIMGLAELLPVWCVFVSIRNVSARSPELFLFSFFQSSPVISDL